MAFQQNDDGPRPERQMYPVDPPAKCMDCGKEISELPFQPNPERLDTLRCLDCHREYRQKTRPSRPGRF